MRDVSDYTARVDLRVTLTVFISFILLFVSESQG